ncbi:unnamed protein product [Toxocara canis]|uniref:Vta1 domain-containing protein n=1 Tax=Toxocara canis TaxID=6265 RepID=A0A183US37_TOXCA|nr:unnamed protein product [Toxocara canis]
MPWKNCSTDAAAALSRIARQESVDHNLELVFQQYLFVYRMVIEILIADDLISKSQNVINFIKEYDEVIQRKRAERQKKAAKSSSK